MYFPGHLGVAILAGYCYGPRTHQTARHVFVPVCIGSVFPDLLDKPLYYLQITPYGRYIAHAAILWVLLALLVSLYEVRKRREDPQRSFLGWKGWFVIGGFTHLFADFINDLVAGFFYNAHLFSAWFAYPFRTPDHWGWFVSEPVYRCKTCVTPLEFLVVGGVIWLFVLGWRAKG